MSFHKWLVAASFLRMRVDSNGLEARVREWIARGDAARGLTEVLSIYGPEVYGFLMVVAPHAARVVYVAVCDGGARELDAFEWHCSLRTWIYAVAHRALREHAPSEYVSSEKSPARAARDEGPYRRPPRASVTVLRKALSGTERELLVLRMGRNMSWREIAQIEIGDESASRLLAAEAVLRRRFSRLRAKLGRWNRRR